MYSDQRDIKTTILLPPKATKSLLSGLLMFSNPLYEIKIIQKSSASCDS